MGSQPQTFKLANFRNVDASGNPAAYVGFLDRFAAEFHEMIDAGIDLLQLCAGSAVIDVGCGHGAVIPALAAHVGPTGRVTGIELSRELVAEAHRRLAGRSLPVEIRVGDARALDIPDGTFDAARADRVLVFVPDPGAAIRELARVTRPAGRVVVTEPDLGASIVDSDDLQTTREVLAGVAKQFPNPWIGRQLRALFLDAGLVEVEVRCFAAPTTSLADWSVKFGVEDALQAAVASNRLSSARADAWLEGLRRRDAAGRFLASSMLCMVAGTKRASAGE
jgi:ubiquinone/menaquinone biosynthesis C-methylase UbiE